MGGRPAGMYDALRDALVVEVGDLLPQVKILQQRRTACAGLQGVIGVGQSQALGGRQIGAGLRALNGVCPVAAPVGPTGAGADWSDLRGDGMSSPDESNVAGAYPVATRPPVSPSLPSFTVVQQAGYPNSESPSSPTCGPAIAGSALGEGNVVFGDLRCGYTSHRDRSSHGRRHILSAWRGSNGHHQRHVTRSAGGVEPSDPAEDRRRGACPQ